jgi:hypothetical protein
MPTSWRDGSFDASLATRSRPEELLKKNRLHEAAVLVHLLWPERRQNVPICEGDGH